VAHKLTLIGISNTFLEASSRSDSLSQADTQEKLPDPLYESIHGTTIYWTCWELNAPDLTLMCHECNEGILKHTRARIDKSSARIKAVFNSTGQTDYEIGIIYQCEACSHRTSSCNGRLLHSLPGWCKRSFPIDPKYFDSKSPNYLLDRGATKHLEDSMLSQGNGAWCS